MPVITSRKNSNDGRALEYYHHVVAPAFSRFPGDDFWTRMVAQASLQEPAVHHAVVAISTFYELVGSGPFDSIIATPKGRYAVVQYNQALQQLTKMRDESIVLFVCILFVCIEGLRENKQGAMTHCRYGIKVFNGSEGGRSTWARDYFRPLFLRLTSCPYFFGAGLDYFPTPIGTETEDVSGPHPSWEICRYRMDLLVARCIRFVREFEKPTSGQPPRPAADYSTYHQRKDRLVSLLDEWLANYDSLYVTRPPPADNLSPYLMMVMMCLVLQVWVSACGEHTEMAFDDHLKTFREVVNLACQAVEVEEQKIRENRTLLHKSKFVLDIGFVPTLYFVIIKCRDLELRQAALGYMMILAPERENLWNTSLLYSVGKRIIELEHGEGSQSSPAEDGPSQSLALQKRVKAAYADSPPPLSRESSTKTASPDLLLQAPSSDARVRDALVLRDPDVRLPGKGLGGIPYRPYRDEGFAVEHAITGAVLDEPNDSDDELASAPPGATGIRLKPERAIPGRRGAYG